VWDWFAALPGKVWDAIKGVVPVFSISGKNIINGIVDDIKNAGHAIWDAITGLFSDPAGPGHQLEIQMSSTYPQISGSEGTTTVRDPSRRARPVAARSGGPDDKMILCRDPTGEEFIVKLGRRRYARLVRSYQ